MPFSEKYQHFQSELKQEIQSERNASKLENLVAALIGELLCVPIAVAKSGFQHGGDAGPAGQHERRFRIECKKYSDTTALSDRELLGEIDHALARDEALEAWFLVATRSVSEQLAQDLIKKGEKIGVPVVILDWKDHEPAPLAALCALTHNTVKALFSETAGDYALKLQPVSEQAIDIIRRNLQSWSLGFQELKIRSHTMLDKIWRSPRESTAILGQDAAVGSREKRIKRVAVSKALNAWWQGKARDDAPATIVGLEGVGKTWAIIDWLVESKKEQPIVLIVPASAAATLSSISETILKRFLADRLYEVTGVRNSIHWQRRLELLLDRPVSEGPVLTIFFDGINQEPSIDWLLLLKVLQGETFSGRVRVIVSTRNHHFEAKLSKLRGLIVPPSLVAVDNYSIASGGELDQMLAFYGLKKSDLHTDLIELARKPRLFKLVVRFRDKLVDANQVTVHRLLWEYGRDSFGERAGKSFSEAGWKIWLKEIAQKYRAGIREFSLKSLGEIASRPDLTESEVFARLSDIIDGRFVIPDPSGDMQLSPTVVAHSLGAALIAHLDKVADPTFQNLDTELVQWLDPITGFDQRSEILRAAVSIIVDQGRSEASLIAGVLVTAWLQTQNLIESHRQEIAILAPNLSDALLDAVEHSDSRAYTSARLLAISALRSIPRTESSAFRTIIKRSCYWLSIVSRNIDPRRNIDTDSNKSRIKWYKKRIGIDTPGMVTVVGINLEIVDQNDGSLQAIVPSIIEGFPLAKAIKIFEVASVAFAVNPYSANFWKRFKWLCIFNETDPQEMTVELRNLAEAIRVRKLEPGVHKDLPVRVASLLLKLSGQESDEDYAAAINPDFDHLLTYQKDYLQQPSRSFFPLERRHADIALSDKDVPLHVRVQRTKELWLDPTFDPPDTFIAEVREAVKNIDIQKLNSGRSSTVDDHNFEEIEPVLARCAPDLLADLLRCKMQSLASCPVESRYWKAVYATNHLLLAADAEAKAARILRRIGKETDKGNECYAANQLLMLEIRDLDAQAQIDTLILADLEFLLASFKDVLQIPSPEDVDALISRYSSGTIKQNSDLAILLSVHPVNFSDKAWSWFLNLLQDETFDFRGLIYRTLTQADPVRFGQILVSEDWSWNAEEDGWVNHYGTGALIEATRAFSLDRILPRLAPWRLLEAARKRGADPNEVRMAAEAFDYVLVNQVIDIPDPAGKLSVQRTKSTSSPFKYSITPWPKQEEVEDPILAMKSAMDIEKLISAHRRAVKIAADRIQSARESGASLYLANIDFKDFEPVLQHAKEMIDHWIEGYLEITLDFERRICLAEGAFIALCEALLIHCPTKGVQLWLALQKTVRTRFIGSADIDDLLHMIFRVPDSQETISIREELIGLKRCHTDQSLFDIAVAASYNGKIDYLSHVIDSDLSSELIWKMKRGRVLAGFSVNNKLPVTNAWPIDEIKTEHANLVHKSARLKWLEACSHHWWKVYLKAKNAMEAYAAWVLFLRSADNRAWVWMHEEIKAADDNSEIFKLKCNNVRINQSKLKRNMEKRMEKFNEKFFYKEIFEGMGPWGKELSMGYE